MNEEKKSEENSEENKDEEKQDNYLELLKRTMAEFDNYRKRSMKQVQEAKELGKIELFMSLIPFLETLNEAVKYNADQGIEVLRKQLTDILAKEGFREINADNCPLDSNLFEVLGFAETLEKEKDMKVKEVVRKGYFYKENVVRYPGVIVWKFKNNDANLNENEVRK